VNHHETITNHHETITEMRNRTMSTTKATTTTTTPAAQSPETEAKAKASQPTVESLVAQAVTMWESAAKAGDAGVLATIAAYEPIGFHAHAIYVAACRAKGESPLNMLSTTWGTLAKVLPWSGTGTTRRLAGKSESVWQRAYKIARYTGEGRTGRDWLAACDKAEASKVDAIRTHAAYERTRLSAYVMWVEAKAARRVAATGAIAKATRTTGAASTRSAKVATRQESVATASDLVAKASRKAVVAQGRTTGITAAQIAALSDEQLRQLRDVIVAELTRRTKAAKAAEAAKLAATAKAANTKATTKAKAAKAA
jgi:hypothetical protein